MKWIEKYNYNKNNYFYVNLFQETSEAVTVVSVFYDTLASILGDVNTTSNLSSHLALASNSSIVSSTIRPLGTGKLKTPVRIVLENDGTVSCET